MYLQDILLMSFIGGFVRLSSPAPCSLGDRHYMTLFNYDQSWDHE